MDASYQTIDYMSLLDESLAIVDFSKTTNGATLHDDSHVAFRGEQLSVSEKMQCFNRLVFERSLLVEDMCFDCLSDFVKVSHYSQKKYESFAQNYEENIMNLEIATDGTAVDTADANIAQSLIDEVKLFQREHTSRLKEEHQYDDQLQSMVNQERDIDQQISEMMKSLNVLQYQREEEDRELEDKYSSSIAAEQEIHLLSSPHFSPLFHLELLAVPLSLSSCIPLSHPLHPHNTHSNSNTDRVLLAINGFRASYSPSAENNLHWTEINAGWSNLCTAFVSHQRLGGSTETAPPPLYSYDLICLRQRGVLVESDRRSASPPPPSSSTARSVRTPPQSYCLSYNHTTTPPPPPSCGHTRGSPDEYIHAILALALVIIEHAVLNCRLDIMTSFSKLNYLHAYAKSNEVTYRDVSPPYDVQCVEVLQWPSLDQLLGLQEMTAEGDLLDLANDVLLSVYCILAPPSPLCT